MLTGAFSELKRSVLVKNQETAGYEKTKECTKKNRNGIKRLVFSALAVFLQVMFIIGLFTRLNRYAAAINTITSVLAFVLVLKIYGKEQTASIKAPWIILILAFPVMGVTIYLLVGLNRVPSKMRTRFEKIDLKLLPYLPDDEIVRKRLEVISPQAAGISSYLSRNAFYPMYQQTDITYFKEAVDGLESQIEDMAKINTARKYCWFMTPYLIITDKMSHALILAAKRGVDVRIITPGIPDKKLVYRVTRSFYHQLTKYGVRIFEWTPGFCHAKISVADDIMATCGTINLDYRSLYHHFEDGCFLVDCEAIKDIKDDFDKCLKECEEVTEKYKVRSAGLRLGQLFMRLFAELL